MFNEKGQKCDFQASVAFSNNASRLELVARSDLIPCCWYTVPFAEGSYSAAAKHKEAR